MFELQLLFCSPFSMPQNKGVFTTVKQHYTSCCKVKLFFFCFVPSQVRICSSDFQSAWGNKIAGSLQTKVMEKENLSMHYFFLNQKHKKKIKKKRRRKTVSVLRLINFFSILCHCFIFFFPPSLSPLLGLPMKESGN